MARVCRFAPTGGKTLLSFEQNILGNQDLIELWEESRNTQTKTKKFRIYLDGLDEIPSTKRQKEVISLAMRAKASTIPVQLVVTSRDHVVGNHLKDFIRIRIRQFDDKQVNEFLTKWFAAEGTDMGEFVRQLKQTQGLHEL